jgi:hypothetical protein
MIGLIVIRKHSTARAGFQIVTGPRTVLPTNFLDEPFDFDAVKNTDMLNYQFVSIENDLRLFFETSE